MQALERSVLPAGTYTRHSRLTDFSLCRQSRSLTNYRRSHAACRIAMNLRLTELNSPYLPPSQLRDYSGDVLKIRYYAHSCFLPWRCGRSLSPVESANQNIRSYPFTRWLQVDDASPLPGDYGNSIRLSNHSPAVRLGNQYGPRRSARHLHCESTPSPTRRPQANQSYTPLAVSKAQAVDHPARGRLPPSSYNQSTQG